MEIKEYLANSGDYIGGIASKIISFISAQGLKITPTISKLITILIFLSVIFLIMKVMQKPIKYAIVVILIILSVAIGFSLVT